MVIPRSQKRHNNTSIERYTFRMRGSSKILGVLILFLAVIAILVWYAVLRTSKERLRVTFLDVGQGDAIFIEAPSGRQMLIDGGKNREVVRKLGHEMPWFDRSIDVVLATHPDADHIGGLPDILKRYDVSLIVASSVQDPEGVDAAAFESASEKEGAQRLVAERGHVINLGGGARFEILFPDRAVPTIETNTGSIIGRLVYGDTSFMLTGDSPNDVEEYLVRLDGERLDSTILKAGHHGSRTSSALSFVGFVSPEYAIFSRGCDNTYGHPHEEVRATFARLEIPTLDTCDEGSITFESDGHAVTRLK